MIYQIRIQNFKSLRDVTVDLSPVTVFIGKSGTGKTNFASAIRFLRDYLTVGAQAAGQHPETCKCVTNPSGAMGFQIVFSVPEFPERFTYSLMLNEQHIAHPPGAESLEYGGQTIYKQAGRTGQAHQWEVKPGLVSVPNPGAVALGRLPGLEEAVVAHTALTAGIGVYAFPLNVLSANASGPDGAAGFADKGDNYLGVLKAITRDLQKGIARKKSIAATLKRDQRDRRGRRVGLPSEPPTCDRGAPFGR